jgi:hypothetical protein
MIFAVADLVGEQHLVLSKGRELWKFGRRVVDDITDLGSTICQEGYGNGNGDCILRK